jgi:GT2 family glycosyltransferase/SAM-dependent methyltransferase/polysaccharide pyruvyl transferase WcaK-like protein
MAVFREHVLAHRLLDGLRGLEIGAAGHNPFGLNTRNVAPVEGHEFYASHQAEEMGVTPAAVDIWAIAEAIPVPDASEDFILSSHVVEHLPNVVKAFCEWNRIVRVGGCIFMIVPLRNALPADVSRPLTTLAHFIDDFRQDHTLDTHPTAEVPGGRMGHYHVFTPDVLVELVAWMRDEQLCHWELVARENVDTKVGNGFTLAFRIVSKFPPRTAQKPREPGFAPSREVAEVISATAPAIVAGPTVGLFGTFELDNYGDRLFPILFERSMQPHLPGVRARLFSPGAGIYGFDGRPVHPVADLVKHADELSGFVIGGGDVIRFDTARGSTPNRSATHADLLTLPTALGALRNRPVIWNAPGVPHALTPDQQDVVTGAVSLATYASVRDEISRGRLGGGAAHVAVVPDTRFLVADVFPKPGLDRVMRALGSQLGLPSRYLAAHLSPATARDEDWIDAGLALADLAKRINLPVVLLMPLGPVPGEEAQLAEMRKRHPDQFLLAEPMHSLEIAALIAHATAMVGTGLQGNITAFAYGVPSIAVNARRLAKLERFGELTGRPVLASWQDLPRRADALAEPVHEQRQAAIRGLLDAHLLRMAEAISHRARFANTDRAWLQLLHGLAAGSRPAPTSSAVRSAEELKQVVEDQRWRLMRQREQLADAESRARASEQSAADLRSLFEAERGHLGWWFLQAARSLRNRLCPRDTWRWRIYLASRAPLRWLLHPSTRAGMARFLGRCHPLKRRPGPSRRERRQMIERMADFRHRPLISVLVPVYNVAAPWLRAMVDSVRKQLYPHWELCLVNDGSTAAHIRPMLERFAALDPRIRIKHLDKNAGISAATNHCLAMATGEFCALLDHDDELTADALFEIAVALNAEPTLDLIYSDEDKLSAGGSCYDPVLKPDWNPALILTCNYVSHLGAYRTALLRDIGGFRPEFDGSQDYDLLLRFTERTGRVAHIPKVLYHWRVVEGSTAASPSAKPHAYAAARRAIAEALERRGCPAEVETQSPGQYRVRASIPVGTTVSVIVHWPERTENGDKALRELLALIDRTLATEVIVVARDDASVEFGAGAIRPRFVRGSARRNIGADLNAAAAQARGDHLVFLDFGVRPMRADWLAALLEPWRAGVAAVGGRVLGHDGRLLHSGYVLDADRAPASTHAFLPPASINRVLYADAMRNCSAVGGGCLLVNRAAFATAAGFDEHFVRSHHDIDLCLRLRQRGGEVVYTPWAVVQHSERPAVLNLSDRQHFDRSWHDRLPRRDPYFHPKVSRRAAG